MSIDTNIIITNYRIFLIPDEEERKWVLHIKDVQESDRVSSCTKVYLSSLVPSRRLLSVVPFSRAQWGWFESPIKTIKAIRARIGIRASGLPGRLRLPRNLLH